MRPLKQPGIAERRFASEKDPDAVLHLMVEHAKGQLMADSVAEKWSGALVAHGDAMLVLKETLAWLESGSVTPPPDLAQRIRQVLATAGSE